MTLTLKIIMDDGAVTRVIKFPRKATVEAALDIIKQKVPQDLQGKDYRLFLSTLNDSNTGVWLENHHKLDYYLLHDGDCLQYLNTRRNLRVKLLDGTLKTLIVDESKKINHLIFDICCRCGISNHEEYGLCRISSEAPAPPPAPGGAGSTLSRRRGDDKMHTLSRKLNTDDNVEWLCHLKSLREVSLPACEPVLLKRKLFYSDANIDLRDPVQLNLLYVQTRDAVLNATHVVSETQATECKERWINIRDVHRRLLKKRISDPRPKYKPYKYEGELTFMLQYYKDITVKNAPIESDVDDDKPLCEDFDDAFASDVDSDSNKRYKKKAKKSKASKKKIKLEDVEKQTETAEFDAADPIDAFLLSIGATLKTFSAYHLNLAKSEIFNVVQQHDLQQIVQRESNDSLSSHVKVSTSEPIY